MDNIDKWCLSAETESNLFSVGRVSTIMLNQSDSNTIIALESLGRYFNRQSILLYPNKMFDPTLFYGDA